MAIRFDGSTDVLSRANLTGALTAMGWFYIAVDRNNYSAFIAINDNNIVATASDGVTLLHWDGTNEETGSTLSVGAWFHLAITMPNTTNGTTTQIYLNGALDFSPVLSSAASGSTLYIGNDANSEWLNGRAAFIKIWNRQLSAAEVAAEMWSEEPQSLNSLWLYARLLDATDYNDLSGAGRNFTAGGALTREDGPPGVGWAVPGTFSPPTTASGPGTYTGSGAFSTPTATASGAGTFTAPVYTGSGDLALPAATLAGTGTFGAAVFTGSGDLAAPAMAASGVGTFTAPVYTGSGAVSTPALTASGTGTFTAPVYTGSGALATPALTVAGSGVTIPGGGHLRFYGTDTSTYPDVDRVRIPLRSGGSPTAVDVGAGDFTYEFWLRCAYADNTSSSIADVRYSNIILDRDIWSNARGHVLGVTRRTGPILAVCFGVAGAGLTWTTQYGTTDVGDGEPHHVALVRRQSTGVIELYVDGALDASGTYSTGDLSYDGSNTGGQDNDQIVIGTEKHDVGVGFAGRLDDLRISNNRRYTGAFTPPTAPLTVDANTVGLYAFDDAAGTQAQDSASGVHGLLAVGGPASAPQWAVADLEPFEASGALTLPAATGSGAGTFTAPIYTGTGALTTPALTVDGAGTFATVGFTGTGDLQAPALTGSGSGTFTAPVYTGSGDLAVPTMIMAGSGTFTAPIYTGSGDLALPSATVEGTGIFAAAVYSGAGDLGLPALTLVGVGTFTAPVYTGSGDLALPGMTLAGVGTHIAPTYTGSGALTSTALTLAGVGTFAAGGVVPHATRPYRPAAEPTIYRVPPEPTIYRPEE